MVDIGKTRLDLPWNAYYDKELDVRFSRSYGPGRYDDRYELEGIDYPAGYVRWTERRNLACFLDLLADGSVDVASLISGVHPVEEAADVYSRLGAGSLQGVGFLLSYGEPPGRASRPYGRSTSVQVSGPPPPRQRRRPSAGVRLGFIGAGNYATSMLLPHLRDNSEVELVSVATTRVAVRAQRPTQVRLRDHHDERRVGARRRHPRRGVHRHAAPLACRPGLPGPRARPHRLRREAARPHRGAARRGPGHRREDRQRPGHGRFQPEVRTAVHRSAENASVRLVVRCRRATWSTPAAWTRAAGTSTRSWKDPGSPARAVISSTR